jgi:DNA-binding MurR/RpiR family transcriptional regulator
MNVVDLIKDKYKTMTTKQKQLADYMLNDPHIMCFITLKDLSAATKITEVTILNACYALGFENFNELKYEFRKYNVISNKTEVQMQNAHASDPVPSYELTHKEQLLIDICNEELSIINNYISNIDISKLFNAAEIILKHKVIVICGRGISFQLAEFISMRLATLGISSMTVNTELNDSIYGTLSFINEDVLLIPISFPDYYYMTNKFVEYAKLKGSTILAITDSESSEVALDSNLVLTCQSTTRLFLNTLSTPMMLANLLTSAVSIVKSMKYKDDISNMEEFSRIFQMAEEAF